jgi:hypothetical protein
MIYRNKFIANSFRIKGWIIEIEQEPKGFAKLKHGQENPLQIH